MNKLLQELKDRVAKGEDLPWFVFRVSATQLTLIGHSISGNVLKDPEAKLNEAELKSIGLTMVSAGLDTLPGNIVRLNRTRHRDHWLTSVDNGTCLLVVFRRSKNSGESASRANESLSGRQCMAKGC